MKKAILFGCLPLVLLLGVGGWWAAGRAGRGAAARGARLSAARTETVGRGEVAVKVTETGTLQPLKVVEVKSKVAGRIARLDAQEGETVRAGQTLVLIDPTEINSQVAQTQAQLDGVRARLRQAERGADYQIDQTGAGIVQARQALRAAEARLRQAQTENAVQPARTRSEIAQAEAAYAGAKNSLVLLQSATQPQAVVQAETGFAEAQAALDEARASVERQEKLLAKGFVSQQALDTARTQFAAALARRDQAKSRRDLLAGQNALEIAGAKNRVAEARAALDRVRSDRATLTRQDEVASSRAAVEQARAGLRVALAGTRQNAMRRDDVAEARAQVTQIENSLREIAVKQTDTRLLAPMTGVVTRRYLEEGELVTSGVSAFSSGQPVVQIADLSRMIVRLSVNEVDVARLRPGQQAEVAVDGVRGVRFPGRIRKVAPAAAGSGGGQGGENGGGGGGQSAFGAGGSSGGVVRFPVEVLLDRPDKRLRPGMSARCTLIIDRRKNVLRLPESCVDGENSRATVQVVSAAATSAAGGAASAAPTAATTTRSVVTGLRGGGQVEIVSGLREGDRVKPAKYSGPPRRGIEFNF